MPTRTVPLLVLCVLLSGVVRASRVIHTRETLTESAEGWGLEHFLEKTDIVECLLVAQHVGMMDGCFRDARQEFIRAGRPLNPLTVMLTGVRWWQSEIMSDAEGPRGGDDL